MSVRTGAWSTRSGGERDKAYLESENDEFLAASTPRPITVQITVPGDPAHLPPEIPFP